MTRGEGDEENNDDDDDEDAAAATESSLLTNEADVDIERLRSISSLLTRPPLLLLLLFGERATSMNGALPDGSGRAANSGTSTACVVDRLNKIER